MPPIAAAPAFYGGLVAGAGALGGAALSSRSDNQAARYQTDAANRAAELEAKSAQEALAFAKEQEAARQREWQEAQQRNYEIYLTQRKDLEPYRRLGAGSIGQMSQPIYKPTGAGSLGQLMGR